MRKESSFNPNSLSPAGAHGLMQLRPNTAKELAQKVGMTYSEELLKDSRYSILLGSYYLRHMLEKYDGSIILAAATYNAGMGNVGKWIKIIGDPRRLNSIDECVDWIELVPFAETRNYIQRILENLQVYRRIISEHNGKIITVQALQKDLLGSSYNA